MLEWEVVALVEELESLGVQLTVTPLLDGSFRLNRWRSHHAWNNRDRINQLLAERIDNSPECAAQIAEFIKNRSPPAAPSDKISR